MAIATKFILILFGMPFALGETFTVTKCCRGHFDIASNECSNEIIGNDSTIDPFDGINKDLVISNYALIECLHPLEIKHATNSFEHQGFILHGGKLLVIEDERIHEKFCLDQSNKSETNVLYCGLPLAKICQDSICVRKCCPKNHIYANNACILADFDQQSNVGTSDWHFIYQAPHECKKYITEEKFNVTKNGLKIKSKYYDYNQYCLMDVGRNQAIAHICVNDEELWEENSFQDIATRVILICMVASVTFLVFSFAIVWNHHKHKLFGAMTLQITIMFFVYFTAIICTRLINITDSICEVFAYVIQFCYVSTIWWLNSMCFDIWSTFKSIRNPTNTPTRQEYGWKHPQFKYYALWSYGMPCLITLITILMENLANHHEGTLLHPGIGEGSCFLSKEGTLLYVVVPTAPILLFNVGFFIFTTRELCCGVWSDKDASPLENALSKVRNITKLFIVTGLTWVVDLVSWLIFYFNVLDEETHLKISFAFDLINALQGFTLFCCLFFDGSVLKTIVSPNCCIGCKNHEVIKEESTITLKEFVNNITGNNRRVYNLNQSEPQVEERFPPTFTQHSAEFQSDVLI